MSTFIQTLRQDLISLRWYLPCWIASLALAIAQQGAGPPEATTSAYAVTLALTLFVIGSGAGVFGSLLFGHTASDDRSAWHTRPLQRSAVGLEKLLMVALLFGISALVVGAFFTVWSMQRSGDIAVLTALGASTRSLVVDALGQSLVVLLAGVGLGTAVAIGSGLVAGTALPFLFHPVTTVAPAVLMVVVGLAGAAFALRSVTSADPLTALGSHR